MPRADALLAFRPVQPPSSMASLPPRGAGGAPLRRPIAYLDWSTLSDAFLAQRSGAPPNAELAALVRRLAGRGTLCYSITHLIELIAMPSRESALSAGRALEQLEHRWFAVKGTEEEEAVQSVRWRLGLAEAPPPLPVHLTMTAAVRDNLVNLTPGGTIDLLSDPTIPGYVRQAHSRLDWSPTRRWTIEQFKRLHADRTSLPPKTTSDDVREVTFAKFVRWLKVTARDALHSEPIVIGAPQLTDQAIDAAVDQLVADLAALPMNKVVEHVLFRVGDVIADQTAGSKIFDERYSSFLWDLRHLVSAAFADVFTCDAFVDRVLGDFRTVRGLPKQLSIGGCGGPAEFVAALAAQVEQAERAFASTDGSSYRRSRGRDPSAAPPPAGAASLVRARPSGCRSTLNPAPSKGQNSSCAEVQSVVATPIFSCCGKPSTSFSKQRIAWR